MSLPTRSISLSESRFKEVEKEIPVQYWGEWQYHIAKQGKHGDGKNM